MPINTQIPKLKKWKIERFIAIITLLILFSFGCSNDNQNKKYITKEMFGDKWPFMVNEGYLTCEQPPGRQSSHLIFFQTKDGKKYPVNGSAKSFAKEMNINNDINEIWADDPEIEGLKISISSIIDEGQKLCNL